MSREFDEWEIEEALKYDEWQQRRNRALKKHLMPRLAAINEAMHERKGRCASADHRQSRGSSTQH